MKRLTYVWSTIGLLILFAVFLMFQMPGMPAWGTVKLTDILIDHSAVCCSSCRSTWIR